MNSRKMLAITGCLVFALISVSRLLAQERSIGITDPAPIDLNARNRSVPLETKTDFLPLELRQIRQRQIELSERDEIRLNIVDTDMRSRSALRGVPAQFRGRVIDNERDIQFIAEELGKYYGFRGREELRLDSIIQTDFRD